MVHRALGSSGLKVSPIAFGAFKIGRNKGIKYPSAYELPDDAAAEQLLNGVLDLGINLIDTAPAYGFSEERIGHFISHRRSEFLLSTKVGETFEDGESEYNFDPDAMKRSIDESLRRLRADHVDVLLIHSDGNDEEILSDDEVIDVMLEAKAQGKTRLIGFSGKTIIGARNALDFADVLMIEYHPLDTSHEAVMHEAYQRGVGVLIKKPLAAGRIAPEQAIPFAMRHPATSSLVIGGLNLEHIKRNLDIAANV